MSLSAPSMSMSMSASLLRTPRGGAALPFAAAFPPPPATAKKTFEVKAEDFPALPKPCADGLRFDPRRRTKGNEASAWAASGCTDNGRSKTAPRERPGPRDRDRDSATVCDGARGCSDASGGGFVSAPKERPMNACHSLGDFVRPITPGRRQRLPRFSPRGAPGDCGGGAASLATAAGVATLAQVKAVATPARRTVAFHSTKGACEVEPEVAVEDAFAALQAAHEAAKNALRRDIVRSSPSCFPDEAEVTREVEARMERLGLTLGAGAVGADSNAEGVGSQATAAPPQRARRHTAPHPPVPCETASEAAPYLGPDASSSHCSSHSPAPVSGNGTLVEQGIGTALMGSSSWDYPLSRHEKKARLLIFDQSILQSMAEELETLRSRVPDEVHE